MTGIVSWNIQCGLGVDGKVDLARIARTITALGPVDVICLQEVCRFMPELANGAAVDQVAQLQALFPEFDCIFGPAIDRAGDDRDRRAAFGNMILSRRPALQIFQHALPQPADPTTKHMPRQATEIVVPAGGAPLRVVTTHLEFHSEAQRLAQVQRLRELHQEIFDNHQRPSLAPPSGPYRTCARPVSTLICGDFNSVPGDSAYNLMIERFSGDCPSLVDAWPAYHGGAPHPPTCGVFDHRQWPEGAHCRDYFFVTPDLAGRITALDADTATDASDHQPIYLRLADGEI